MVIKMLLLNQNQTLFITGGRFIKLDHVGFFNFEVGRSVKRVDHWLDSLLTVTNLSSVDSLIESDETHSVFVEDNKVLCIGTQETLYR